MMKNAMSKRVIALVIIGSVMGTTAAQAAEIKKDESVYVTLDSEGKLEKATVSDWIHSDEGGVTVFDKSNLKDIKNVKSDIEPQKSGENLIWDMDGSNLYYQGTTNKSMPLDISIKYYYEDEEINPEDLAGKSGKVKIEIDVKNKEYKEVNINGKMRKIYTPFIVAGELTLPNDKFSDITTDGATTVSEGNNVLVAFAKMPGLNESLGLDTIPYEKVAEMKDKADILSDKKIVVEANAEEFSLGPIMITATSDTSMLGDLEGASNLTELKDKLDLMQSSYNKILDGETQIKDGIVNGYAEAKTKIANESPRMQGMIDLVKDDYKVARSRQLLQDAYEAKDMPTDELKREVSSFSNRFMNSLQLVNNDNARQKLKTFAKQCYEMKQSGQLDDILTKYSKLVQMKKSGKIKNLKEEYEMIKMLDSSGQLKKFKDGYVMLQSMKKSGDLDKIINSGKNILNNYEKINETSQLAVSLLNNKGVMLLLNDINNMESAYGNLTPETKQVLKVLSSSITAENLNAIKNMNNELTPVQENLKNAINAAGGIDNFVTSLRSSLSTLGTLSHTLSQVDFASINSDVSKYGSAYLTIRAELMYAYVGGGNSGLEAKKDELKQSVEQIYKSNDQLVKQLKSSIDLLAQDLTADKIQEDCKKAQSNAKTLAELSKGVKTLENITPLLSQISNLTSDAAKLKATLNILTGQNQVISNLKTLVNSISALPKDQQVTLINMVGKLGDVMDHIDSNKQTIDTINASMGKYLSQSEIKKLNEYANQLNSAKDTVSKLRTINISSSDIPDIDVSKLNIPNIDTSILDMNLPEIDPSILSMNLGININDIDNIDGVVNDGKVLANKVSNMSEKLLKMQGHLKNDEDILKVMNDAIEAGNITEARKMINQLPNYKSKLEELNSGIQQLSDGMQQFKNQAIDELYNKGTEGINVLDELSLAKDEITNASKQYGCFSGKDDSVKGTTKFIIKTKEIKYEAPKDDDKNEVKTEKKGFFEWIKSLLGLN